MEQNIHNVLFLCRQNSGLSIMAEAILNNLAVGKGRFNAYSAGSHPVGHVDYFAFEQIRSAGLPSFGLQSKNWNQFTGHKAPQMQFVFVVGEDIATEQLPVWQGNPIVAHWRVADPVAIEAEETQKRRAFSQAFIYLYNRINIFASLPLEKLDRIRLQRRLDELGTDKT